MSNSARPRVDGGRSAARGLRYQYMATLDVFLDRINDPDLSAVRVEGGLRDEVSDAVDFDMVTHDGRCLLAAQIKSKYTSGATISAATAFTVLLQLVAASDAESYLLRCAAFPGPGATQLAACLRAATSDEDLRRELEQILRPSNPGMLRLPDAPHALERLRRARLDFDTRTKAELTADLKQRWVHILTGLSLFFNLASRFRR